MTKGQLASIIYHELFSFSLYESELLKWQINSRLIKNISHYSPKNSFKLRKQREKISQNKIIIAKKAASVLSRIPTVQFVGITGSLAMMNAKRESDIDLLIITSRNTLWTTRLICYPVLLLAGFPVRKPQSSEEKDKLCLNMWIDERDLKIAKKNLYTAHEIVQIVPLVNKSLMYEKFIYQNKWALNYWPHATEIPKKYTSKDHNSFLNFIEPVARTLQFLYMKNKRSRELVTNTRAFFHPFDWGEKVITDLTAAGLEFKK